MKLIVRITEQAPGLYSARVPALPGCAVRDCGSYEEAMRRIREAADGYVASLDACCGAGETLIAAG